MQAIVDIDAQVAQPVVISENWTKKGAGHALPVPARPPAPVKPETGTAPAITPPIELADPRIKRAVAARVVEAHERSNVSANQHVALRGPMFGADTSDKYKQFTKDFAYAKVPYCLGDNGLKFSHRKSAR